MAEVEKNENNLLREELARYMRMRENNLEEEYYFLQKKLQSRKRWLLILKTITTLIVFIAASYALNFLEMREDNFFLKIISIAVIILFGVFLGSFVLSYLDNTPTSRINLDAVEDRHQLRSDINEQVSDAIAILKDKKQSSIEFSESDKAEVLARVQAKLESDALHAYVEGIREIVSSRVKEDALEKLFGNIIRRLGGEVQDLAKRGNLNLTLGMLTTIVGLFILGYSVFYSPITLSIQELLAYFLPRISLVVLVEIFAYFFLRLYKQSLSEIKYFQNEITNIESRQLALHITMRDDDASLRSKVVEELSKTERNFLIGKDQTTVDLERERMARGTYSDVASVIKDLLKRKSDD